MVRNATEALNTVLLGLPLNAGDEIVCSAHDYFAMLDALADLRDESDRRGMRIVIELTKTADPLTPRELETLRLIARGQSNQEIAESLVVHERTIAKYVSSILDKLQLANRTQAALYALREGLSDLKEE